MIILAGTIREALNRRIVLVGGIVSVAFVGLFWLGFALAFDRLGQEVGADETVRAGAATVMTVLGLYAVQFLGAFLAILLSAGAVAGELDSGRALAVLARPLSRGSWLAQRAGGFGLLASSYIVVMAGGVLLIAALVGGYSALDPLSGIALMVLEVVLLGAIGVALSTRLPAVPAGAIVVSLYGLAWMAGIMEFVGRVIDNVSVERIGVAISLVMPSDALWRAASYELSSPVFLAGVRAGGEFGGGIPFAGVTPISGPFLAWSLGYLLVTLLLAARALHTRDL